VQLEIWQKGYQLYTSIPVYVTQDGTFSAVLFDGNYKLVSKSGNGPWVSKQDTVDFVVKAKQPLIIRLHRFIPFPANHLP
jgi:hypothetical protein